MSTRTLSGSGRTLEMAAVIGCLSVDGGGLAGVASAGDFPDAGTHEVVAGARLLGFPRGRLAGNPSPLVLEAALDIASRAGILVVAHDCGEVALAPFGIHRTERVREAGHVSRAALVARHHAHDHLQLLAGRACRRRLAPGGRVDDLVRELLRAVRCGARAEGGNPEGAREDEHGA